MTAPPPSSDEPARDANPDDAGADLTRPVPSDAATGPLPPADPTRPVPDPYAPPSGWRGAPSAPPVDPYAPPVAPPYAAPPPPAGAGVGVPGGDPYGPPPAWAGPPAPAGYGPPPYGVPYGPTRINGLAVASLILSISALACGITAVLGIVFGHIALGQIRRTGEQGRGLAIAGLVIGYAFVGLVLLLVVAVAVVGSAA